MQSSPSRAGLQSLKLLEVASERHYFTNDELMKIREEMKSLVHYKQLYLSLQ